MTPQHEQPDSAAPVATGADPDAAKSHAGAAPSRTAIELADADLVLRGYLPSDAKALVAAFADPQIDAWNGGPAELSEASALAWLTGRADWSSGDHASWAISDPRGTLLGSVSLFQLGSDQLDGEIGYWLVPAARGRGLASRSVRLAAAYAFDQLGVRRLTLFHAVDNPASCRVATAAGFRLEGTLRESHRYGDGIYHDEHIHGRLASDPLEGRGSART